MMEVKPLLLRPVEAAELLGISRSKCYEMIAAGELPSVRMRSSVRVPLRALEAMIEEAACAGDGRAASRESERGLLRYVHK